MEKRDIDEFINIFFGTGEDYPKRAKEFLDKIGKHYEKLPGGINGLKEIYGYIAERIKENKEIIQYIKTKDKSVLTEFLYWMPEIFDNEFLKEVVEKREEYGLSDISSIIMKINDIDYTKRVINEREKYGLSDYDIVQLVISFNDEDYTKEVIENYGIKDRVFLIQLIKSLTDVNYVINIVENKDKYKLQSNDIAELVRATGNVDYIKEVVEKFEQYGLENSDIVQLVKSTKDNEYIKNIIEKFEEYGFNGTNIIKLVASTNDFNYISLPLNLGIGGAVQTGYKYAFDNGYDYAIQFDGDGQHDATYIEALITELEKGVDLVIGSRFINDVSEFKSTKIRRIGISILSFLIKIFTGKKITDPTSGFRACNKKIIELFSDNYPIDYPEPDSIVYVLKKGYSVFEIPVKMKERVNGLSSINAFKSVYYMIKVSLAIMITALSTKGEKNEN